MATAARPMVRQSRGLGPAEEASLHPELSLCELLDRVLNKGVVLTGELTVSVADVELLYVAISVLVSSVETLVEAMSADGRGDERRP